MSNYYTHAGPRFAFLGMDAIDLAVATILNGALHMFIGGSR